MKIGYACVSSQNQNLHSQLEALALAGYDKVFQEKKSGTKVYNRPELDNAIEFCREWDTLIVTRLDRCSRNVKDFHQIIETLNNKKVGFKATEKDIGFKAR